MPVIIDFGNVEEAKGRGRKLLDPGVYQAEVMHFVCKDSKNKPGTQYFELEYGNIDGENERRKLWQTYGLSVKALPFLKRDLVRLGVDLPDSPMGPAELAEYISDKIEGDKVTLDVDIKVDDRGQDKNTVDIVPPEKPANGSFQW